MHIDACVSKHACVCMCTLMHMSIQTDIDRQAHTQCIYNLPSHNSRSCTVSARLRSLCLRLESEVQRVGSCEGKMG